MLDLRWALNPMIDVLTRGEETETHREKVM